MSRSRRATRSLRPHISSNAVSLAGEFLVLAELSLQGLVATLTLGHTKGVDVLALNPATRRAFSVEVKTTTRLIRNDRAFGPSYAWMMRRSHGERGDPNLVYCFVSIERGRQGERRLRYFLVPSAEVRRYIQWEYAHVERYRKRHGRRRIGRQRDARMFRIPADKAGEAIVPPAWQDGRWRHYEGNWRIFARRADRRPAISSAGPASP
jgi:hypothetical protein